MKLSTKAGVIKFYQPRLARAHAGYVTSDFNSDSTSVPGLLKKGQIQQYHEVYFESRGLSKHTFGGVSFGINNDFIFGWCNGCDSN